MSECSFNVSRAEREIILKIADRAAPMFRDAKVKQTKLDTIMDLSACVANGNPLRLEELLKADDFNFAHDVFGIYRHINRDTGKLENCFLPRFTAR